MTKLELHFITSNSGKVKSLQAALDKLKAPVTVKQYAMKLDEIQADDPEEISQQKARDAFKELKKPLVVEDSGFCINALNGFPGVYSRYILDTIGADGIMKLMEGKEDRSCHFTAVATFIDAQGKIISFRDSRAGKSQIAKKKDTISKDHPLAWSADLWKIYMPEGSNKTLSSFTDDEFKKHYSGKSKRKKGSLVQLAEWLAENLDCLKN